MEVVKKQEEQAPQAFVPQVTEITVPMALLEILMPFTSKDNQQDIDNRKEAVQAQIDQGRNKYYTRALWYIAPNGGTIEDAKNFLVDKSVCRYFVFAPKELPIDYVKNVLATIRKLERTQQKARDMGIRKKKPMPIPVILKEKVNEE